MRQDELDRPPVIQIGSDIERFRLPGSSTNRPYRIPHGNGSLVVKVYEPPQPSVGERFSRALRQVGIRQSARHVSATERCAHERLVLQYWTQRGFAVPRVDQRTVQELQCLTDRVLVMEFLNARPLQHFLQQKSASGVSIEAKLDQVFSEMASRHTLALRENSPLLAHLDANTGNVLLDGATVFRLDFETIPDELPVVELLAREVVKLCRWIARDW